MSATGAATLVAVVVGVSPPLPRIVRILHRDCDYHGLLAKRLKGNGSLRRILDEAVTAA